MARTPSAPPRGTDSPFQALARAWLAGVGCGALFLTIGAVRGGSELLGTSPVAWLGPWVTMRSIALFAGVGGVIGVVVGAVWIGIARRFGHSTRWLVPAIVGAGVSVVVLAYVSAWWQLDVLAGLPLAHGERLPAFLRHAVWAALAGLAVAMTVWLVAARLPWRTGRRWLVPLALVVTVGLGLTLAVSQLGLGLRRAATSDWRPSQVVVVAVDGVTLRVLAPMLARHELPTFQRLIDEGAWGSILTYGVASSPVVWTSVATGKRARNHGIVDFVTKNRGGYRARPMRSTDWRARAVWSILGDAGRTVGVVNWLMSAPPQPVNGAMVTQLDLTAATARTYPPSLKNAVAQILERRTTAADDADLDQLRGHVDNVFDTALLLLDTQPLDFLALYQSATDAAEHTSWRDYQPEAFDDRLWPPADPARAALIPEIHRHLDARLGALLDRLDDDALLIVVSDHGQLPAATPRLQLDLEALLLRLGWGVAVDGEKGRIDRRASRVYPLVETKWTPSLRLNVNLAGREHNGIVEANDYRALIDRVAADLSAIRFADGTPLFARVTQARRPSGEGPAEADVVLEPTRRSREATSLDDLLVVGTESLPLRALVEIDRAISGDHDRQGVLFVHGRGIRPGPIGQRTVTTALQRLIWHLTDRVDMVDAWLPVLGRLGVIERATTLDIAPTVLFATGLPVARDMAGRPLVELFGGERAPTWTDTYEQATNGPRQPANDDDATSEADAEMLERLRALGYVN